MTDRDHFAAAAFAGFIRGMPDNSIFHLGLIAKQAYEVADAMLRERGNHSEKPNSSTIHDAAPAARATTKPGGLNSGSASGTSGEQSPVTTRDCGTGDTRLPKEKLAEVSDGSYQKTDENRGNCDTCRAEVDRLRDAIRRLAQQDATLSVQDGNVTVTMDATLTDAERSAIADAADRYAELTPESAETAATLRGLLERMK